MDRNAILKEIATIIEADSLKETEALASLDDWDSIAVMSFIAMVDEKMGKSLPADRIAGCKTVSDLVDLCLK